MSKTPTSSCPRCGYDLSGDIASWNGADSELCPCAGRCSECGLEFEWSDIFDPFRNRVRGFIEHEDRGLIRAAWRTWLLALLPSRFWKRVKIEFEPRVGRMVLWLAIITASAWIIGPLVCNAVQLYIQLTRPRPWRDWAFVEPWVAGIVGQQYDPAGPPRFVITLAHSPGFVVGPLAASVMAPLVLLCLPDTRKIARVRAVHVARAAVYGLAWLIPMLLLKSLNQIGQAITWVGWARRAGVSGRLPLSVSLYDAVHGFVRHTWGLWFLVVLAWLAAWWWFSLRVGWRVRDYDKVMRALIVIGLLAAAVAIVLSDDGYRMFL